MNTVNGSWGSWSWYRHAKVTPKSFLTLFPNGTAGFRKSHKVMPAALPPMAPQHHIQYFWVQNVSLYHRKGCISYGPQQCWDIKTNQEYLQSFKQILLAPQVSSRELRNIDYRTIVGIMSLICWQRLAFAKPLAKDLTGCASDTKCTVVFDVFCLTHLSTLSNCAIPLPKDHTKSSSIRNEVAVQYLCWWTAMTAIRNAGTQRSLKEHLHGSKGSVRQNAPTSATS